jgi:DNA-binding MurR/RpiR family transcriptional regulator
MKPSDVLFVVDFRRYQPSLLQLAKRASTDRSANVVLVTDKWMSPILRHSTEVVALPIESGTVWDSYAASLVLIEAMLTRIAEQDWNQAHQHISDWDALRLDLKEIKNGP